MTRTGCTSTINMIYTFFLSMLSYILAGIIAFFSLIPVLILLILGKVNRVVFWLLDFFYKGICFAALLPIKREGLSNIPKSSAIFIANHQSVLDIPLMGALLNGRPHFWYVLEYYKNFFLLGYVAGKIGIFVDRGNGARAGRALVEGVRRLNKYDTSTVLFPEGTRHSDGRVHDFFQGFALLAQKSGKPVVPVYLHNLGKIYPMGSFLVRRYPIRVIVGEPFNINENETLDDFTKRVHAWFVAQNEYLATSAE